MVVTYDVGRTAIVWDLFTGEQLSRFVSYEPLRVAHWMRNGNIAFGKPSLFQLFNDMLRFYKEMQKVR